MSITMRSDHVATARITRQGQISVPKAIRAHLEAGPGDDLEFEPGPDGSAIVRRRRRTSILDLAGIDAAHAALIPADPDELDRLIGDGIAAAVAAKVDKVNRRKRRS